MNIINKLLLAFSLSLLSVVPATNPSVPVVSTVPSGLSFGVTVTPAVPVPLPVPPVPFVVPSPFTVPSGVVVGV